MNEYLTKLKELCEKATPGAWNICGPHDNAPEPFWHVVADMNPVGGVDLPATKEDAQFIAESRMAILRLIKALKLAIEQRNNFVVDTFFYQTEGRQTRQQEIKKLNAEIEKILGGE